MKQITEVFLALRHTEKGGARQKDGTPLPGDLIGSVGRKRINELQFPKQLNTIVDLFGTAICRTQQEVAALTSRHFPGANLHDPLEELGNESRFKDWVDRGLMQACKTAGSNLGGLKATLSSDEFTELVKGCQSDLAFAFSETFTYAIGVLHTPMIELLVESYGFTYEGVLLEDTGFVFVRCDDQSIHCMGFWQSGDPLPEIGDELPE